MATKKRELFDAAEYAQKMDVMIANLRTQKPGEAVGQVGKNDILALRREALQQLVADGYTVQQIAEAMKNSVFSILPKTITEIVKQKEGVKVLRVKPEKAKVVAKVTEKTKATESALNTEVITDKTIIKRNTNNNFVDID